MVSDSTSNYKVLQFPNAFSESENRSISGKIRKANRREINHNSTDPSAFQKRNEALHSRQLIKRDSPQPK
jgi:hypothetical protein